MAEEKKVLTKEEKQKIVADYKAQKKAEKEAKKAEIAKEVAIDKAITPEQKTRIDERAKEIKAESDRQAAMKKEEAKQIKAAEKAKIAAMSKEDAEKYKADQKAKTKADRQAAYEKAQAEKDAKLNKLTEDLSKREDCGGKIHRFFHAFNMTKFCRFFSNGWLKFKCLHPTGAAWVYQIFFFIVFSEGVTIWQFLVMLFLPYAFASLSSQAFVWPAVTLWAWPDAGKDSAANMIWAIFNEPVQYKDGVIVAQGGLGNFIAFEIAVFTAQCINFPLQRNITYRSHGNPWYQAMWYFIGWVLISLVVNMVWGFVNPILLHVMGSEAFIYTLIKTFITGGISMVIFFFIFRIIFPAGAADTSHEEAKKEILAKDAVLKA
jgi:hypothetical protein